ncbi:MotE family protein [Devosia submarina]|uniref:MotE family protein n=1 Tax=Devosia submarina TaxID=1173082 RepID=UPI000D3DA3C7|nr:MotE family protein [Devosia submarina]
MNRIRLLPVVVMAIAALLVLKTLGLVTNGGYVLGGVGVAQAASGAPAAHGSGGEASEGGDAALPGEHTIEDISPTLVDTSPTLASGKADAGGHGAPAAAVAHGEAAAEGGHDADVAEHPAGENGHEVPVAHGGTTFCRESDAEIDEDGVVTLNNPPAEEGGHGAEPETATQGEASFAQSMTECLESGDAIPVVIDGQGGTAPLSNSGGTALSEQQLLERLAERRTALEKYEQDLALRASIVDAAEKRIEERAATLEALEAQISALVDQRTEMESGQFAGIVAMYETMKPKDAAGIFNNLDMEVLLRVAKTMSPRKMAPILAAMDPARAQELTVKMASLADRPAAQMTADDLAALPQIVGQ